VASRSAQAARVGRSQVALTAVRLLALAALVTIAIGVWDVRFGPYAASQVQVTRLQSDVANTRHIIQPAKGGEPVQALAVLQQAQQQLSKDLDSGQLSPQSAKDARTALNSDLPAAVQDALQRYNKNAHITPLTSDHAHTFAVVCPPPSGANSPP